MSRKGPGYENDPVRGGRTGPNFVCRHAARNTAIPYTEITAGTELALQWNFGAAHVGDCSVYISYDVELDRAQQKYFKIANLPRCKDQNRQDVTIMMPDFLPAGNAILRWDWWGLHGWPAVEWYSQCVDITITSSSTVQPAQIMSYSIIEPPIYPGRGNEEPGFRNPWGSGEFYMTGPACAGEFTGNNCELTAIGTRGNTGGGGSITGGGGGSAISITTPAPGTEVTDPEPMCEIYTVVAGDTLISIAQRYTAEGKTVTWQEICAANAKADCNSIDVGDDYVIPCATCNCANAAQLAAPDHPALAELDLTGGSSATTTAGDGSSSATTTGDLSVVDGSVTTQVSTCLLLAVGCLQGL